MNSRYFIASAHFATVWTFGLSLFLGAPAEALDQEFDNLSAKYTFRLGIVGDSTLGLLQWRNNGILVSRGVTSSPTANFLTDDLATGGKLLWNPNTQVFRAAYIYSNTTHGVLSAAFGGGIGIGFGSFAAGFGWGNGDFSAAFGNSSAGKHALSAGYGTNAAGEASFAAGQGNSAFNLGSSALGLNTQAHGQASTALGFETDAYAYGSVAIGQFNVGERSSNGENVWLNADPVFEVGIGTSSAARANAMTVYKSGKIILKKQGDILMGEFGTPGSGD